MAKARHLKTDQIAAITAMCKAATMLTKILVN